RGLRQSSTCSTAADRTRTAGLGFPADEVIKQTPTMSSLSVVDLVIVAVYIVGTTLLAGWFARRQRGLSTYFLGDRNVAWWLILTSIVATETSTVTFLSSPGLAFNPEGGNLTFLQLTFGYVIGRIVVAWLLLPQYLRGE